MGTDVLVKWQINEVPCKSDRFRVQLLNYEYEQFAETQAKDTSTVLFNNTSPEGIYHVRIRWDVYSTIRDLDTYAVGLENVNNVWHRPTLELYASKTSIRLSWEAVNEQIDFYTVIILENETVIKIVHIDPHTTDMELNETNPCTMYEFSVGAKSNVSNKFYDLGHITYNGSMPTVPHVTDLGKARVRVRWTTNPYCIPDLIHVHFREPANIGVMKIVPGTDETMVITGIKQCIQYAIQLGFSYTTGKEDLSEPVYMSFLSDGILQNSPKLSFEQNGSLLVQWLLQPGCVVNHTVVTVETNDLPAKEYKVIGDQPLARLDDLEQCAFHTVYVTTQYENGYVERTNSSEIHSFTKEIGLAKIKTYIVDDGLSAHWESTQNCQALGYRIDLVNPMMGHTTTYLTDGTKYRVPIGECVKSCQLLVSAISVHTMAPVTTLIHVRPERVPTQPPPPLVRRDGAALFVWWTQPNLDFTIQSHKLFMNDSKKKLTIFEVKKPRGSILLNSIEENVVYSLSLRAINEHGESKPSLTVQYKWDD
ncbi:hypothetical protein PHET_02089 [Paragonimus heterotremus]|uniref:Fibronectin type-III domain-containing protein n=1 Tax=Paragonimus heterotremus TaxID=100268 RepID=A0A8J4ST38_9TREM|nr:hypothetical protein PHET_02089 [Paragonimus heterotremus]